MTKHISDVVHTSTGVSWYAHIPLVPSDLSLQPSIPAHDFPEKVGYVSPGVHLIINDMKEGEQDGGDTFFHKICHHQTCMQSLQTQDVVTPPPKHSYYKLGQ